jgi:putative Holliday junction resolvase
MRRLGLDIGIRRIGVALSDPLGVNADPLEVLEGLDPAGLRDYIEVKIQEGIGEVVVGLPLTSRGEEGEQARYSREYARAIEEIDGIEVILWDERFSTIEAERKLREAGHTLRGREVDAEAAAVILQTYLDYMSGRGKDEEKNSGKNA